MDKKLGEIRLRINAVEFACFVSTPEQKQASAPE